MIFSIGRQFILSTKGNTGHVARGFIRKFTGSFAHNCDAQQTSYVLAARAVGT
jgi:hypothetical protein